MSIKVGWPDKKEEVQTEIRNYFHFKEELTVQDGILFKGNRVIVPVALRPLMVEKVHSSEKHVMFYFGLVCQLKSRTPSANATHATASRITSRKSLLYLMNLPNALGRM